jgi:Crp-like helix-turn-helix domain
MGRIGIRMDLHDTHWQLGTMISVDKATVSRAMIELRNIGAVEVGRRIYLRNRRALERAAEALPAARNPST